MNPFYLDEDFDEDEIIESESNIIGQEKENILNDTQDTIIYDLNDYMNNSKDAQVQKEQTLDQNNSNNIEKMDQDEIVNKRNKPSLEMENENENENNADIKKSKIESDKGIISILPGNKVAFSKKKVKEVIGTILIKMISQLQ